jgi:ABC-type methionine transport system permease subunit
MSLVFPFSFVLLLLLPFTFLLLPYTAGRWSLAVVGLTTGAVAFWLER